MNDYYEVRFALSPASSDMADLLADALGQAGYESFVAGDSETPGATLTAYVPAALFSRESTAEAILGALPDGFSATFEETFVEGRDWNAEWEKNYFSPIVVGGRVAVAGTFHTDVPQADINIYINPKMAFGTGHHATTTLMMEALLATDCHGLSVVDMGTGTGILAILARILGAAKVLAVEIDEFAAANTAENIALNLSDDDGDAVELVRSDASALKGREESADLFLANINRNIIVADMASYSATLRTGGHLVVSGFYVADRPIVESAARAAGLVPTAMAERDNGSSMPFVKEQ